MRRPDSITDSVGSVIRAQTKRLPFLGGSWVETPPTGRAPPYPKVQKPATQGKRLFWDPDRKTEKGVPQRPETEVFQKHGKWFMRQRIIRLFRRAKTLSMLSMGRAPCTVRELGPTSWFSAVTAAFSKPPGLGRLTPFLISAAPVLVRCNNHRIYKGFTRIRETVRLSFYAAGPVR